MQLSESISNFLEYCEITKNRSQKTIENYKHYLSRFQSFFGHNSDVEKLNIQDIQKYRLYLNRLTNRQGLPLSIKTQSYHIIALRAFLKYLVKNDIKTLSPEKIELPKIPKRTVEALSENELERLFAAVDLHTLIGIRDIAILETLYSTGLRVSELVSLDVNQVDLQRREFMVRGKGSKPRIVFLSQNAVVRIKNYLALRKDNQKPLFINSKKENLLEDEQNRLTARSIQYLVSKYALKAGIIKKVTPHVLRHTFATQILINGADIRSVQDLLGHSSITTTQVYTHLTDKKLKEIHDKFHK